MLPLTNRAVPIFIPKENSYLARDVIQGLRRLVRKGKERTFVFDHKNELGEWDTHTRQCMSTPCSTQALEDLIILKMVKRKRIEGILLKSNKYNFFFIIKSAQKGRNFLMAYAEPKELP